jgi:tRNA-dihydrouridine synthase C
MKLFLAPMDGVVDWVMRDLLTRIGGIDRCVTEFVRVVDVVYPDHVFYRRCPELKTGGLTASGTPVFVQILGGQAEPMAGNALRAVELGAPGIDINFGCPAKTVNKNDGGASLLKSCDRIYDIVKAVRTAVPAGIPVTVKIRLGYEEPSRCIEIAQAIEDAGADLLTVHCRTKLDGYKPPAYWEWIPRIREKVKLEMVVNGEIWSVADYQRCREVTGESNFMIGRGAVADPYLFQRIKGSYLDFSWLEAKRLLPTFYDASLMFHSENFAITRTKQWLKALSLKHPEAGQVFESTRKLVVAGDFKAAVDGFVNS